MSDAININWYPGHMTKANRRIQSNLKLVDCVAEIIDARIPISSSNPELKRIIQNKPRVLLFNKADISDQTVNSRWIQFYKNSGVNVVSIDAKRGKGLNKFIPAVKTALKKELERRQRKGMTAGQIRVMVVGVPNVGKSSFINRIVGHRKARVEDRPGVTRGNQWFYLSNGIELLDTPGVLWPKIKNERMGESLAFTGAVKDNVIDVQALAVRLIEILSEKYLNNICDRYKIDVGDAVDLSPYELFMLIGKKRGFLMSGGVIDTQRTSEILLDEFRMGRLGKISLESPDDIEKLK